MEIQKKADEVTDLIYRGYGSIGGHLFGLDPDKRKSVRSVVVAVLRVLDDEEGGEI